MSPPPTQYRRGVLLEARNINRIKSFEGNEQAYGGNEQAYEGRGFPGLNCCIAVEEQEPMPSSTGNGALCILLR